MTDNLTIHENIPGAVAAWTRGDGTGAYALITDALNTRAPELLLYELWQYMTFGWVEIATQTGIPITIDNLETFWSDLATITITNQERT